ncbi:MAG: transporter [Elusimicrobia bacterium]|nr:transporter [Elusimicrobiota bacterium]
MKRSFSAAALAVALFSAPALAFTHLAGEDTIFLGKEGKQLEGWLDYSVSKEGADRYSTGASARLSYGFLDGVDLMVTVPWHGWNSRGISESGLGDASIEAKFRTARSAEWTLALRPGFSLPAGDEARSLGAGKGGVWLYGIAGTARGPWEFYLNAGFLLNSNSIDENKNILKASAAAVREIFPELRATAELSAATGTIKDPPSNPVASIFGLVWSPYPALDLDAGLKLGLTRAAENFALAAGVTLRI